MKRIGLLLSHYIEGFAHFHRVHICMGFNPDDVLCLPNVEMGAGFAICYSIKKTLVSELCLNKAVQLFKLLGRQLLEDGLPVIMSVKLGESMTV